MKRGAKGWRGMNCIKLAEANELNTKINRESNQLFELNSLLEYIEEDRQGGRRPDLRGEFRTSYRSWVFGCCGEECVDVLKLMCAQTDARLNALRTAFAAIDKQEQAK